MNEKIIPPPSLQAKIAKAFLPIQDCCSQGCKKCPYGRWLKRRGQHWHVLIDELLKLISPYLWIGFIATAYVIGRYA